MLIVEGTDLLGKTTLCEELRKRINARSEARYTYEHFSKLPKNWLYYWDYIPHMRRRIVMDRFHMSEIAYRWARGEDQVLSSETYRILDGRLRTLGAYTVVVVGTGEVLNTRIGTRPETHTGDQIQRADLAFKMLIGELPADEILSVYHPDVDHVTHVTSCSEYPSMMADVDTIVEEYLTRQATLNFWLYQRGAVDGSL